MSELAKDLDSLWNTNVTPEKYGDKYQDHLFEQYKLYVEMADRISARRATANAFFLTLHTIIIGFLGVSYENGLSLDSNQSLAILLPLLVLCLFWWALIRSYRQLNSGKYKVIGEFERRLPTSPYWSAEWKVLGEGKDIMKYLPLTHVENWIPVIFGSLYIIVILLLF